MHYNYKVLLDRLGYFERGCCLPRHIDMSTHLLKVYAGRLGQVLEGLRTLVGLLITWAH